MLLLSPLQLWERVIMSKFLGRGKEDQDAGDLYQEEGFLRVLPQSKVVSEGFRTLAEPVSTTLALSLFEESFL